MSEALDSATYDELWDQWKDYIRYHPGARHRRRLLVELLASLPPFEQVLDVGCGLGQTLDLIQARFPQAHDLTGVDLSPHAVDQLRARGDGRRYEVLDLSQGHLDEQFELVICGEVIEHLQDQAEAVRNLVAMTKPGGHLLVTCPTGRVFATERSFGHLHHPTLEELEALGASLGLDVVQAVNWGWPFYRALKWATNIKPDVALNQFANGRYGLGKKLLSRTLYRFLFVGQRDSTHGCQLLVLFRRATT